MYPRNYHKINRCNLTHQRGIGLPAALFLIIVMIMIVAAINNLNEMNASAYGREWLSMSAFYAAESGAQTAAIYVLNPPSLMPTCDNNFISGLTPAGLPACEVNVACSSQTVNSTTYITLTSTGRCGSGVDAATRIIQVRVQP
jgi:MSHA biogenesis protein MshP